MGPRPGLNEGPQRHTVGRFRPTLGRGKVSVETEVWSFYLLSTEVIRGVHRCPILGLTTRDEKINEDKSVGQTLIGTHNTNRESK